MRPYICGLLCFVITAGVFTLCAIVCTIAAVAHQELVRKIPRNIKPNEVPAAVTSYPRREGFFHLCHTNKSDDYNPGALNIHCLGIDLGSDERFAEYRDPVYNDIIEWRRSAVATVFVALFLAVIGLALLLFFVRFWLRALTLAEYRGYERLSVALILLLSGCMYKLSLFCLHLEYVQEKISYSSHLPYIFTNWNRVLRQNTDIQYSHCYNLLWASMILVELAGILILLSMLLARYLTEDNDLIEKTLNYQLTLPRYSTYDMTRTIEEEEEDEENESASSPRSRPSALYFNIE